jgi:hypothetical protein
MITCRIIAACFGVSRVWVPFAGPFGRAEERVLTVSAKALHPLRHNVGAHPKRLRHLVLLHAAEHGSDGAFPQGFLGIRRQHSGITFLHA